MPSADLRALEIHLFVKQRIVLRTSGQEVSEVVEHGRERLRRHQHMNAILVAIRKAVALPVQKTASVDVTAT